MAEERIYSLEVLRGLAAFGVATAHFFALQTAQPYWEEISAICVEIFFPLSGYVLSRQLFLCLDSGVGALRVFYLRRWMRTLPPYYFALIGTVLLSGMPLSQSHVVPYLFFFADMHPQGGETTLFPIAWSLAVEEYYYLLFPLFLLLTRRWNIVWMTVAFIGVFQVARIFVASHYDLHFLRTGTPLRLDSIALGFLANVLTQTRRPKPIYCLAAVAVLAAILFALSGRFAADEGSALLNFTFVDLASLFGLSVVILAIALDRWRSFHLGGLNVAAFLGVCSYPMYLFHLIVLRVLTGVGVTGGVLAYSAYIGLVIGFAALFHYIFEKPILTLRPRYRRDTEDTAPLPTVSNSEIAVATVEDGGS